MRIGSQMPNESEVYEFFCNDCNGWIMLTLNPNLRGTFVVECPKCGRKHPRCFKDGQMKMPPGYEDEVKALKAERRISIERDGGDESGRDVIKPLMSAYSKESRLEKLRAELGFTADSWARKVARAIIGEE